MTGINAINRHMDNRARCTAMTGNKAQVGHQLFISCSHVLAVNHRLYSLTADLLEVTDTVTVYLMSVGSLQRFCNRM